MSGDDVEGVLRLDRVRDDMRIGTWWDFRARLSVRAFGQASKKEASDSPIQRVAIGASINAFSSGSFSMSDRGRITPARVKARGG